MPGPQSKREPPLAETIRHSGPGGTPPLNLATLGRAIKDLRERRGMSQLRLANDSETNTQLICALETGGSQNPSLLKVDSIARALGVTLAQLLMMEE